MIVSIALKSTNGNSHSAYKVLHARTTEDGEGETQETPPLLVIGIDGDLQRAERLQRPEHEPRLARILTDVPRGEALHEVAHEELEVRFLVQDASASAVGRDVVRLEDVLGVGLQARRFRRVSVGGRRAGHDFERG